MPISDPIYGAAARRKILNGVNAVYNVVRRTLGPEGKNALLPRTFNRGPRITNDGVTISENIRLKDEHESLAAEAFKEGSKKTNDLAGDGTTGTAVISGHLINKIFNQTSEDTPFISSETKSRVGGRALRKEMMDAKKQVIEKIKERAKKVNTLEDLKKIAVVSIGKEDEKIADIVAETVWDVARDGGGEFIDSHFDVVEGYKGELEVEKIRGMRFPSKVAARAFITNPEQFEMIAEDVPVLITNHKLDNPFILKDIIEPMKIVKLAIFSPDFSTNVLKSFVLTNTKTPMTIYPIKCASLRTEILEDLAVYTGATVIDKDRGKTLQQTKKTDLGFASKIVVRDTENREDAILLGGKGEQISGVDPSLAVLTPIQERCEILKKQMLEAKNDLSKVQLQKRIANLSEAVGVFRVGASTSGEGLFLKLKIEDGVNACKAALEEGYVKGGGLCLKEIAEELPENILTESLKAPYDQIQTNAGGNLEISEDVIDSAKVVRLQVEHGVSIASILTTADISIPEIPEKSPYEGYEKIAQALSSYTFYWAKQQGLIKEANDYQEQIRNYQFQEVMDADKS